MTALSTKMERFVRCPPEALLWEKRRWRLLQESSYKTKQRFGYTVTPFLLPASQKIETVPSFSLLVLQKKMKWLHYIVLITSLHNYLPSQKIETVVNSLRVLCFLKDVTVTPFLLQI
jgi:hypothetical protein